MIKNILLQVEYSCPHCSAVYNTGIISPDEWQEEKACDGDELTVEGCGHEWKEFSLISIFIQKRIKEETK